ncbi:septum formation initiator protein [Enterococcus haemoperoxidus ATCC BAA-382]|uniref:Septum formation initiator protein n=1 Tax=Enterococcus haemoperoxidus ATCC BAA-382 TaxID=1158608 RepID=R2QH86_9ENTE|nr:septum formation initiator family protein [Enterococcus haemoperoxidus]EOH94578.1 septum formation initiator protein [Enterococcus haemoperoxidus ATCC BAA-382]EOT60623.1 septum formation initiator protein [Enterococcus haemoperoxidus ATCC BAA-382]OJG52814.1 septum formation initiator protein [Enterococcus haemoperoxidus]
MGKKKKDMDKVAALDNEYTKEQYAEFQKQQKQLIFRRRRLAVVFLVAFVIFIVSGIQLMKDYQQLSAFKTQQAEAVAESAEADKKLNRLEQDVALLRDDDYVAKLARSRYYVSKEGEQIYNIPELGGTTSSSNEQKSSDSQSQSHSSEKQSGE